MDLYRVGGAQRTETGYFCRESRTAGPVNLDIPWMKTVLPWDQGPKMVDQEL